MNKQKTGYALPSLLAACAALLWLGSTDLQAQDKKADATGTWTWATPGRNDGPERKFTLVLQQQDSQLTGKLTTPGRDNQERVSEIEEGSVKDGEVSFKITREFNDRKFVIHYKGKVSGDTLTGTMNFERQGEARSREWTAQRIKAGS